MGIHGMEITTAMDTIVLLTISNGSRYIFFFPHPPTTPRLTFSLSYISMYLGDRSHYRTICLSFSFSPRQLEERRKSHFRFFSKVIKFRKTHSVFRQENFLKKVITINDFHHVCLPLYVSSGLLCWSSLDSLHKHSVT